MNTSILLIYIVLTQHYDLLHHIILQLHRLVDITYYQAIASGYLSPQVSMQYESSIVLFIALIMHMQDVTIPLPPLIERVGL